MCVCSVVLLFYMHECLPECMYMHQVYACGGGQKWVSDHQGLGLQAVVSHRVGARN